MNEERFECMNRSCRRLVQPSDNVMKGCSSCGKGHFKMIPHPVQNDRVDEVNILLKKISEYGRHFFRGNDGTCGKMEIDINGKVWFLEEYTKARIYTHYPLRWSHFSNGGSLRDLIKMFRDYIKKGTKVPMFFIGMSTEDNLNLDTNIWGYDNKELVALRNEVKGNNVIYSTIRASK